MIKLIIKYWKPLLLFALMAFFVWRYGEARYDSGHLSSDTDWSERWLKRDKADLAAKAQRESEERAEERRRQSAIDEVTKDAQQKIDSAVADAKRADLAAERLHNQLNGLRKSLRDSNERR